MRKFKPTHKRVGLVLVLAWLVVALASPLLMPAWSQTTYMVEYIPVDDAYTDSYYPDNNYGSESSLKMGGAYLTYIKFDLSNFTLPVERIVSAKLKLYFISAPGNYLVTVYYVSGDSWAEETITHSNKPSYDTSLKASTDSFTGDGIWIEVDVTNIIAQVLTETDKIISLTITRSTNCGIAASKEYAEADKWPRLIIQYEPYTEVQTQTITETVTITETATETITETQMTTTTVTDYVTETQTTTVTQTDTVYTTETAYTTSTVTTTQTITDVITETATTTITETHTAWANETVTITTTITPTTTITEYGNATLVEQSVDYQALADMLMPIVLIVGVISTLLGLLLQSTSFRRGG